MSRSAIVRAQAARVIAQVATQGRSLDAALAQTSSATAQERGLLRSLCYDSIRWYIRLDALLQRLLARPGQSLDADVHALAIVGLCQLIYSDVPPHAAVDETVNATRALKQPRAAGLINAVLRRYQRDGAKLAAAIDSALSVRVAHPEWLVDAITADWHDRAPAMLEANNQRPPFWVRVNRRRSSGADYRRTLAAAGHEVVESRFDDHTLLLAKAADVRDLPGFGAGLVSVQDAAAQLAAHLLEPAPGDRILDACAAPGGKTCHLLELQPAIAELTALDVSKERLVRVHENLERLGLSATVIAGDAALPSQWWDGRPFDRILLDVPCSATGVIRRHPDIKLLRRAEDVPVLAERQRALLAEAWHMLKPGGRLLYASCSVMSMETTAVVADFVSAVQSARDVTQDVLQPLGIEGKARGPGHAIPTGTAGMDGFYYACLEKIEG